MGARTRIFIDFWNFQLNWNTRTTGDRCDWRKLPIVLIEQAQDVVRSVGMVTALDLEEVLLYASIREPAEANLKQWLQNFLANQPSYQVKIRERRPGARGAWCNTCRQQTLACASCGTPFQRAPEKGVDSAIVTDLLSLAWERAYDLAILVTSDADFVPAVERIQERGLKVINATWAGRGFHLARTCWGSFHLDAVTGLLVRA